MTDQEIQEIETYYEARKLDGEILFLEMQTPKLITALREARAVLRHVQNRIRDPLMRKYILEVLEKDNAP
jgi:hypothetical protein